MPRLDEGVPQNPSLCKGSVIEELAGRGDGRARGIKKIPGEVYS